jgi:hypothetical protein
MPKEVYYFSKIRDHELRKLVKIKQKFLNAIFNDWFNNEIFLKEAYIVGAIWNFVILEKLAENTYQYFISINFDSTKIEELKGIYKNLLFVKDEIFKMVDLNIADGKDC